MRKGSGRNFYKLTTFLEKSPFRNMAVSPWVLAPEQPNLHRINGFFLENPQNTLDLSYNLMARSYGHLKEKFAIFSPHPLWIVTFLRLLLFFRVIVVFLFHREMIWESNTVNNTYLAGHIWKSIMYTHFRMGVSLQMGGKISLRWNRHVLHVSLQSLLVLHSPSSSIPWR